jgi:hypothetical protein
MVEHVRRTPGRRTALLLGAALASTVMAACRGADPAQEETTMPTSTEEPQDAVDAGRALLEDAQEALDEAFGDLDWIEGSPAGAEPRDGGCRWTSPTRRCDTYLGRDLEDHQRIADALNSALSAHGLPSAPVPTGGTGGWLTTSSTGEGTTLSFRSKGIAELTVTVDVGGDCSALDAD